MRGETTSRSGTTLCQWLIFWYSVAAWIPTAVGEVLRGTPHVLCGTTQTRNPSPRVEEQLDYFQLGVNQFLVWQWKSDVTKKNASFYPRAVVLGLHIPIGQYCSPETNLSLIFFFLIQHIQNTIPFFGEGGLGSCFSKRTMLLIMLDY